MSLTLTPSEFFEAGPHCEAFDALLFEATSQKSVLSLSLGPDNVEIMSSDTSDLRTARVGLTGLPQVLLDQRTPNSAQVLYPMLGDVTSIDLSASNIFALRSHKRSIADFWARNLFHALSSTHNVEFVQKHESLCGEDLVDADEFTKRYLWVLRDAVPDSNFKRPDILEKLMIDFHFPVISYENEVFTGGMNSLRRINAATLEGQRQSHEDRASAKRFGNVRSELLAVLAG